MPDLSIIIVNWNTRQLLADCLKSIEATLQDLTFEVIVVDNGSTDGSQAMLGEQFPYVRLMQNLENVGFARANNHALAVSGAADSWALVSQPRPRRRQGATKGGLCRRSMPAGPIGSI
ncbi:MAG: glycosyltransferase [Chloroflexi bacterium]|nr:glycosyltransferase [Chloroflexota bacterium]